MPERSARAKSTRALATTRSDGGAPARPAPTRATEAAQAFAARAARVMDADRCEDVLLLDLRGISTVCDYFVIGTGTSDRQMRAATDHVEAMAAELGEKPYGRGGYEEGTWIVLDFVDVVIHLFDGEKRAYYDLESLWGDCPKIEWSGA